MVEIFVRPEWVTPVFVALFSTAIILMIGSVFLQVRDSRFKETVLGLCLSCCIVILAIWGISAAGLLNDSRTVSNPLTVSEEHQDSAIVLPDEIKSIVIEELDVDKVIIEETNGHKLFETLSNGDFIEFSVLDNGQKRDGIVYFTKENMVINLAVESDNVEVVEVPTE